MEERVVGRQIKAARALLGWKRRELADRCGVSIHTVRLVEADETHMAALAPTRAELRQALEAAGVAFAHDGTLGIALVSPAVLLLPDELNASNDD